MIRLLVEDIILILNSFPSINGISTTMSPSTSIEEYSKLDFSNTMINFESYVLMYTGTTNNMKSIDVPAIALRIQTV